MQSERGHHPELKVMMSVLEGAAICVFEGGSVIQCNYTTDIIVY